MNLIEVMVARQNIAKQPPTEQSKHEDFILRQQFSHWIDQVQNIISYEDIIHIISVIEKTGIHSLEILKLHYPNIEDLIMIKKNDK